MKLIFPISTNGWIIILFNVDYRFSANGGNKNSSKIHRSSIFQYVNIHFTETNNQKLKYSTLNSLILFSVRLC